MLYQADSFCIGYQYKIIIQLFNQLLKNRFFSFLYRKYRYFNESIQYRAFLIAIDSYLLFFIAMRERKFYDMKKCLKEISY